MRNEINEWVQQYVMMRKSTANSGGNTEWWGMHSVMTSVSKSDHPCDHILSETELYNTIRDIGILTLDGF